MNDKSPKNNGNQDVFSELMKEVSTLALLKESGADIIQGKILVIIVGLEKDGKLEEASSKTPKYCNIKDEQEFKAFIKENYCGFEAVYVRYFRPGDVEISEITRYVINI